ncbi:MAG: PepSY domain-containing protein [Pseudomonadota bacterium]
MMRSWTLTACLLLVLTPCIAVLADSDDHMEARRLMKSGSILPLPQVLESIQDQWSGRILEVELESKRGGYIYEIELLDTQGAVWELKIDAVTGDLLETEQED